MVTWLTSFDYNYQNALCCNLCNVDLCQAWVILQYEWFFTKEKYWIQYLSSKHSGTCSQMTSSCKCPIHLIPKWLPHGKNWHELHGNEVIRASLGGIRIRKLASWWYKIIAIFLCFQTCFLCHRIYAEQYENDTWPLWPRFMQLTCTVCAFSAWCPYWNKVYYNIVNS